jgi:hypothetical protein
MYDFLFQLVLFIYNHHLAFCSLYVNNSYSHDWKAKKHRRIKEDWLLSFTHKILFTCGLENSIKDILRIFVLYKIEFFFEEVFHSCQHLVNHKVFLRLIIDYFDKKMEQKNFLIVFLLIETTST